jgi:hypothetical protein
MPAARTLPASFALVLALGGCAAHAPAPVAPARPAAGATLLDKTAPEAARDADEDSDAHPAAPPAHAADRPGKLLIYSAITGHVALDDQNAAQDPTLSPAQRESARANELENEIQGELERQEQIQSDEQAGQQAPAPPPPAPEDPNRLEAAAAPTDRDLPKELFSEERVTIAKGEWGNPSELEVLRLTLDADRNGTPEEIRYVDPRSGKLLRVEQDLDFDGRMDTWKTYVNGVLSVRVRDENGDGKADAWERYENGRLVQLALDSDHDGVRDLFFRYQGPDLVERLEDANDDGTIDRIVTYQGRHRVKSEEDQNHNGTMDTWTTYAVVDGQEVVAKIARDSHDEGKPDVFETYETQGGETRLVRREEDLNRDGKVDVVSVYDRKGRLVQRAISDDALAPL